MDRVEEVKRDYAEYKQNNSIVDNRFRPNIVKKYAYMNACKPYIGSSDMGRIIGCNHATILHSWKSHETNAYHSKDSTVYIEYYEECCTRINNIMGQFTDPLHSKSKSEVIKMYRDLEKKQALIEALYSYAEEPCSKDEEVPGVLETT